MGSESFKLTSIEEKGLTLEDTQGMFLLLGAGFVMAVTALISEWMGDFKQRCYKLRNKLTCGIRPSKVLETVENEIDRDDSQKNFPTRSNSLESGDSLEGKIINVTEENLIIHYNPDTPLSSRRSSSVDLEREVAEIFRRDVLRKNISMSGIESKLKSRETTASKGAFGNNINFSKH